MSSDILLLAGMSLRSWPMKKVVFAFLLHLLAIPFFCAAQSLALAGDLAPKPLPADFKGSIAPLLEKYCTDCHSGEKPKGDLNLEFADGGQVEQRLNSDHKLFE